MKELLLNFGFNDGEAELYSALLKLGEATIDECVKIANIRRTTAYSIVKKLIERGLIAQVSGKPVQFKVLSPRETLGNITQKHIKEIHRLDNELPSIADELISQADTLYKEKPVSLDGEQDLMILRGTAVINKIIQQSLVHVQKKIRNIIKMPLTILFGQPVKKEIEGYRARGIDKRMIFEDVVLQLPQVAKDCKEYIRNGIVVKHIKSAPTKLLIFDDFASYTVIHQNANPESITSLITHNKELIALHTFAFDMLWEIAEPLTIKNIENISM